jgi:hypothetical protein
MGTNKGRPLTPTETIIEGWCTNKQNGFRRDLFEEITQMPTVWKRISHELASCNGWSITDGHSCSAEGKKKTILNPQAPVFVPKHLAGKTKGEKPTAAKHEHCEKEQLQNHEPELRVYQIGNRNRIFYSLRKCPLWRTIKVNRIKIRPPGVAGATVVTRNPLQSLQGCTDRDMSTWNAHTLVTTTSTGKFLEEDLHSARERPRRGQHRITFIRSILLDG